MTVEFGLSVKEYLATCGMSINMAAADSEFDPSFLTRVTHGDRELSPHNALALMETLRIPPEEQALFLLMSSCVSEQLAQQWLTAFRQSTGPVREMAMADELRKYISRDEIRSFSRTVKRDRSHIIKVWEGDKGIGRDLAIRIAVSLEMPEEEKANFLLTAAGFEFKDIERVLENYRNSLTPEQKEIVAAGYKRDSIAVRWGIDPIS